MRGEYDSKKMRGAGGSVKGIKEAHHTMNFVIRKKLLAQLKSSSGVC